MARLFSHLYALGRCSENVRPNPQQSLTNYLVPIARRNRIEIMTTPTSGGSGDGVRSGPGSRGTRTGPDFIMLSLSTTERLLFKPKQLWVTDEVVAQPKNVSLVVYH